MHVSDIVIQIEATQFKYTSNEHFNSLWLDHTLITNVKNNLILTTTERSSTYCMYDTFNVDDLEMYVLYWTKIKRKIEVDWSLNC